MCDREDRPETPISVQELAGDAITGYWSDVCAYIDRRIDNSHDAEDVAQSAFLKLASVSNKSLIVRNPFGFLRTIANRTLAEFYGKQAREREHIVWAEDMEQLIDSVFADDRTRYPTDDVERHQHYLGLFDQVDSVLAEMSATQRAALILAVGEGFTHAQVAERLGLTELTVKGLC